ncbi:MAG: ATP-binding protein [Saccharofermentans sp.]|nr:ATP-binding protein [Saccharofermentans sp.]
MIAFVTSHFALCVVGVCFLIFAGLAFGYIVGNNVYNHNADEEIDNVINKLRYEGGVHNSIINNVNLGIITYDPNGVVYYNRTVELMSSFLGGSEVPKTITEFLDKYEQNNHLKSDYLLNVDNTDTEIRVNYSNDGKIFEIKILHRIYNETRLDIVIIDDITQIKDDERRQKDLAANVSHELKTPLTVIRASEFFVNGISPDNMPSYDEVKKWGDRIVTNAIRMQDIVQDFLTLSMCQDTVPMTVLDIGNIISRALSSVQEYPGRDRVQINAPKDMYYPLVFGNENLIMRIVINLLTNAIKYMPYDGKQEPDKIEITVSPVGDRIGIEVSDNGRGVSQKDIGYLFERFFRVDTSGSRDAGGSGIGLAIVKDIIDMHDGTITVNSELYQGSSFTVMLPLAAGVFESVYEDAKAGVVSEKPYYRTAADFMAVQAVEAARSMGYDDVTGIADEYEAIPQGEKTLRDKKFAELLTAFGDDRYIDLVDELTYIDPDMLDEDEWNEDVEAEDDAPIVAEIEAREEILRKEQEEALRLEQEERERKEAARALLTQQILPRSVPAKSPEEIKKESVTVHPKEEKKSKSNGKKTKKTSLFLDLTGHSEDNNMEIKSAVKQVLDETEGK